MIRPVFAIWILLHLNHSYGAEETDLLTKSPASREIPEFFGTSNETEEDTIIEAPIDSQPKAKTTFGGQLALSDSAFNSRFNVTRTWFRYLSAQLTGFYENQPGSERDSVVYGPEVAAISRLENPTNFVPFVGATLGYALWNQTFEENGRTYQEIGESPFVGYFFGLAIAMTKNFHLGVERRMVAYALNAPKASRNKTRDQRYETNIHFGVRF